MLQKSQSQRRREDWNSCRFKTMAQESMYGHVPRWNQWIMHRRTTFRCCVRDTRHQSWDNTTIWRVFKPMAFEERHWALWAWSATCRWSPGRRRRSVRTSIKFLWSAEYHRGIEPSSMAMHWPTWGPVLERKEPSSPYESSSLPIFSLMICFITFSFVRKEWSVLKRIITFINTYATMLYITAKKASPLCTKTYE